MGRPSWIVRSGLLKLIGVLELKSADVFDDVIIWELRQSDFLSNGANYDIVITQKTVKLEKKCLYSTVESCLFLLQQSRR